MKLSLHDLTNVNTVLGMLYDENGVYRAAFEPDAFYNTILLDTLKYGDENYVHLKHAETINIRRGEKVAKFRRWAGLTPTLRPLKEGIPPAPDKHAYEVIEVGNVFSFGRWSEYTDRVDLSIISEVIAERSLQYGEVANQTKELYARKTWLASPNDFYANFKSGFASVAFGDEISLDDLRFLTQRMKRMLVKPIGGKFNYICSSEFLDGLIDDPRVKQYMQINQTTGNLWGSGEPFDMFGLNFIPTMLDEFAYPDTEFPGVYEKSDGTEVIRLYAVSDSTIYYMDVHEDFEVIASPAQKAKVVSAGTSYLSDGTAVEDHAVWEIPTDADALGSGDVQNGATTEATSSKISLSKSTKSTSLVDGVRVTTYSTPEDASGDYAAVNLLIDDGAFLQLPVHRGILFGMEALIKLNVDGVSDSPQIIVKELGSSGVADALNQRQSVGFKVDGFGLAIKRPEAVCVTYGIPKFAEFAALTDKFLSGDWQDMDGLQEYDSTSINRVSAEGLGNYGELQVDGVNAEDAGPGIGNTFYSGYKDYTVGDAYGVGSIVRYTDGKFYIVTEAIGGSSNTEWADVTKTEIDNNISLEKNVLDNSNDDESNIK
jgi:hypothetical protein